MSTRSQKHHWIGLTPRPDKFFGFCYIIEDLVNNKFYVGRKQYWKAAGKVKKPIANKCSDKWNPKHWRESNWSTYTGSSSHLNREIKKHGKESFIFKIISQHCSKASLNYSEVEHLVKLDALRKRNNQGEKLYYNGNIGGIKYIPPERQPEEEYL